MLSKGYYFSKMLWMESLVLFFCWDIAVQNCYPQNIENLIVTKFYHIFVVLFCLRKHKNSGNFGKIYYFGYKLCYLRVITFLKRTGWHLYHNYSLRYSCSKLLSSKSSKYRTSHFYQVLPQFCCIVLFTQT